MTAFIINNENSHHDMVERSLTSSKQILNQQFPDTSCLGLCGPQIDVRGLEGSFQEGQMVVTVLQEHDSQSRVPSTECVCLQLRQKGALG